MKNFNMPDFVSPTLEQEEMERLKKSLTKHISKKDAEEFLALIPLAVNAGADQRGLWVENMCRALEDHFDKEEIIEIRKDCYCDENGRLQEAAKSLREVYESVGCDLENMVAVLNESGAGWYMEGKVLYTKMFVCECPMLEQGRIHQSLTWCHCTAGYSKALFEQIFERPVEVEVLQSIKQGFDYCLMRVEIV